MLTATRFNISRESTNNQLIAQRIVQNNTYQKTEQFIQHDEISAYMQIGIHQLIQNNTDRSRQLLLPLLQPCKPCILRRLGTVKR